eukprot:718557-Pelagomonas_calceolata.AAC.8
MHVEHQHLLALCLRRSKIGPCAPCDCPGRLCPPPASGPPPPSLQRLSCRPLPHFHCWRCQKAHLLTAGRTPGVAQSVFIQEGQAGQSVFRQWVRQVDQSVFRQVGGTGGETDHSIGVHAEMKPQPQSSAIRIHAKRKKSRPVNFVGLVGHS